MPKLTKRVIDGLKPQSDRDVVTWDSELRGFGVRIKPSGASTFLIQYRNTEGRSRRMSIGSLTVLTPDEARQIARERLVEVTKGADPAEDRKALRAAPTVTEVCDWYLEQAESGDLLGRRRRPVASSTLALDRSRIDTHVKPLIGNRVVRGLTVADLERFQADIRSGKTAKGREGRGGVTTGGAGVASRTLGMLHTVFEQAARWQLIEVNPARGVRRIAGDNKRDRRLSLQEIQSLGEAMRSSPGENPAALAAIRLMLLTGLRRMEALGLQRRWIDGVSTCIRFPITKTGPQVRAIGKTALALIRSQEAIKGNPYVFPGETSEGHFIGIARVLQRMAAKAKLEDVTPHVLRHTFASVAADMGFSELTVAGLLGHASRGVTQRYVHLDKALLLAANQVSAEIDVALDGVVELENGVGEPTAPLQFASS